MSSIGLTASLALLFFLYLSVNRFDVEGGRVLSKEEISEIEIEFQSLKKPAIKTIKDDAGDIFDCVDIMAQPAFDHPLLKNHKLKMRPTSFPRESGVKTAYRRPVALPRAIGCPRGSVPIRRVEREDLKRVKSMSPSHATAFHPQTTKQPGTHLAVLRTVELVSKKYSGVEAYFNILNPRVGDAQAWSSAQLFVENGTETDFNSIQAGWTVSPELFNDNQTRNFVFWIGKGNQRGCYNLLCRGFIQIDRDHALGRVLPTSLYGEVPRDFPLSIHQDNATKDWWLVNIQMNINYGYWPKELFPHLEHGTPRVAWGGVTREDPNLASPAMGSGYFPDGQFKHSGYFTAMKVVNGSTYIKQDPDSYVMETYSDVPTCYNAKDYQVQKENGYTFMYGGPGGNCGV